MNVLDVKSRNAETVTFGEADRGFVYAVARRIVGSAEEAEDVTQDTLLTAFRHRDSFRGESRYRTWLYRIAFTTALGHLRRRARSREVLVPDARSDARGSASPPIVERMVDPAPSAEHVVIEAEQAAIVRDAVAALPAPYREVLIARIDATEPVVAQRLGISVANVKVRAHRARKQLRDVLAHAA